METTVTLSQGIGGLGPMLGLNGDTAVVASVSPSSGSGSSPSSSTSSSSSSGGGTVHDRVPIILTHEGVSSEWKQRAARGPAGRDINQRNRIAEHVERTLGTKIELFISERQPCHGLTIDVLVVPPTDDRPFYVLVTRGLSEMHMNVHPLAKHTPSRIELVICLPKTWEVSLEAFRKSEQFFWPVRQLKRHALFPAIHNTFISLGHTIANELVNDDIPPSPDNPSRPFCSNTNANSMLMMVPALLPEEFHILKKSSKKKKKRARKRAEANGQSGAEADAKDQGTEKDPDNTVGDKKEENQTNNEGEGNSTSEGDNTLLSLEQPPEVTTTKENNNQVVEKQVEREEHEQDSQLAEPPKPEEENGKSQEAEKKKGRRRRGGKRKNKNKNGGEENSTTPSNDRTDGPTAEDQSEPLQENGNGSDAAATAGESDTQTSGVEDKEKGKEKEGGGVNKQAAAPQRKPKKKKNNNEKLFVYGESKDDIYFYQLLPLYQEEVDFKLKYGLDALLERLEQLPPLEVLTVNPGRRNVCQTPVKRKILRAKRRTGKTADAQQEKSSVEQTSSGSSTPKVDEEAPSASDQPRPPTLRELAPGLELKPAPQPLSSSDAKPSSSEEVASSSLNGKGNEHK